MRTAIRKRLSLERDTVKALVVDLPTDGRVLHVVSEFCFTGGTGTVVPTAPTAC